MTPEDKLIKALEASTKYNSSVIAPFNVVKTKPCKKSTKKKKR